MRLRTALRPIAALAVGALAAALAIEPPDRLAPSIGPVGASATGPKASDARPAALLPSSPTRTAQPAASIAAMADDRALRLASEADPMQMLTVGEGLSGRRRPRVIAAALEALAAVEPRFAVAYLAGVEGGDDRDVYLAAVAAGFARADVDAAVDWLATLDEDDGAAFYPVIREVAAFDLARAIELDEWAMALDHGGPGFGESEWFFRSLSTGGENFVRIANQLIDSSSPGLLATVLEQWARQDPFGPIAWIQSQEAVSSLVVSGVAATLAEHDFRSALTYADQMTGRVREIWIEAAFEAAAEFDARSALALLEDYRDENFYAETADRILLSASRTLGPARAAALAGGTPSASLASRLAQAWTRLAPAPALNWALSLDDESLRIAVAESVVRIWTGHDPVAASARVDSLNDPVLRARLREVVCKAPNASCSALL